MVRDYTMVEIDDNKNPFNYDRKERIAELTKRLIGYGYGPKYINKKALGRRFGVSHTQIYRDLQIIAKSIEEYKHIDNLDVDESFEAWIEGYDLDLEPYSEREKTDNNGLPDRVDSYDQLPDSVKHEFKNHDKKDNRPSKPKDVPSYEDKVKGDNSSSDSKEGRPRKPKDVPNYQSENKSSADNNQSNERDDFIPYDQLPQEVKEARSKDAWERLDEINPKLKKRLCNEVREKKANGVYD